MQLPGVVALGAIGIVPPASEITVPPTVAVTVPPTHVVVAAGVAATVNPVPIDVRLSVKLVMVALPPVSGLLSVIVSKDVPPRAVVVGLNALAAVTLVTRSWEVAVAMLLPTDVCKALALIVLVRLPIGAVGPTSTVTTIVQLPRMVELGAIGIDPPEREISVVPGVAVSVPPQLVVADAMVKPVPIDVRLSENAVTAAAVVVSAFVSVIVRVDVCPCAARVGENALVTPEPFMTSAAVAAAVLLPSEVCKAPMAIVLVAVAIAAVAPTRTGTVMVQLPAIGIDPPLSEINVVPDVAVSVPPQLVVATPPIV